MRRLDYSQASMPDMLARILRITSPAIAVRFARTFGGRPLYIPRTLAESHPIARCVGRRAATRICRELGGGDWTVPAAVPSLHWLDARALKLLGVSNTEIAARLGISDRHVRHLLRGFEPEQYEIDDMVRSIGRLYGIRPAQIRTSVPRETRQIDMGWPVDAKGMRLTEG